MSKPFSHKSFEPHITLLTFIQGIMYINRTFIISIYTYLSDNQCTFDGSGLNSDGSSRKMNTRQVEQGVFFPHLFFVWPKNEEIVLHKKKFSRQFKDYTTVRFQF